MISEELTFRRGLTYSWSGPPRYLVTVSDVPRLFDASLLNSLLHFFWKDRPICMSGLLNDTGKSYSRFGEERVLSGNGLGDGFLFSFNHNSEKAFGGVYERLYGSTFYFARRFVDPDTACDITSDAFYKLWVQDKDFKSLQAIKVFLQVVVRNACINHLKHEKLVEDVHSRMDFEEEATTEMMMDDAETLLLQKIYAQIEKLPAQAKRIFKMAYLEGLRERQIAKLLHLSENTVRNQKARALKLLRIAVLGCCILFLFCFH
jgi:RNA polymerase sigma-70 factor (family 1)